jgi:hypothetical protein
MHQIYRYMMLLLYLVSRRYPQLQHLSSNMEQSIQWRRNKVQELKTQHEHVDINTNDNNLPGYMGGLNLNGKTVKATVDGKPVSDYRYFLPFFIYLFTYLFRLHYFNPAFVVVFIKC